MGNLNCYAVVVPGLEAVAAEELGLLAAHDIHTEEGGVAFTTSMDGLFRMNLRLRCVTRILLRLATFKALSFPELYNKTKRIDWSRYIAADTQLDVKASCHSSKLMHSGRTEQAVMDGISDQYAQPLAGSGAQQQVMVRMHDSICTISLDTSGERLDRRGYRLHSGKAPLRETIAAGMLQWMQWQAEEALLTPMCGSGTFAIEAAWMAEKRAVGLGHDCACTAWPGCNQKRWQRAVDKAAAMHAPAALAIHASDNDVLILQQAKANAEQAGVLQQISFSRLAVAKLTPPDNREKGGLIICNPPYGDRVKGDVKSLYQQIGRVFAERFQGWRMAVMVPDQLCERALAQPVKRRLKIKHGGKWVHVLHIEPAT